MTAVKHITLFGVSFRTAPANVRETLTYDSAQAQELIGAVCVDDCELVIVSTCNRTEFYLASANRDLAVRRLMAELRRGRPHAKILDPGCHRYELEHDAAAEHLFRVATGLDSAVLGDAQVLGQVKRSVDDSAKARGLGPYLHATFTRAIRAGKRARTETDIGCGAASVGAVVADLLRQKTHRLGRRPKVVVVGAGTAARNVAQHVAKRRFADLCIVNRTLSRARDLARLVNGTAAPMSELNQASTQADVVVGATGAPRAVVTSKVLDELAHRDIKPLLVDVGMPPNIVNHAAFERIGIDDIRQFQGHGLERRRDATPQVDAIVAATTASWRAWHAGLPMEGVIRDLHLELAEFHSHVSQSTANGKSNEKNVERAMTRSIKQIIHGHVLRLRALAKQPEKENSCEY